MSPVYRNARQLGTALLSGKWRYNAALLPFSMKRPMLYRLSEQNIRDGRLTDDDFSQGLGAFPVKTFLHSDFPHAEALRRDGCLPPDKKLERANAIYRALQKNGLTEPNYGQSGGTNYHQGFDFSDAEMIAEQASSSVQSREVGVTFRGDVPWQRHYALIKKFGYVGAHNISDIWIDNNDAVLGQTTCNVLSGVLNEGVPVGKCRKKVAAFALLTWDLPAPSYWAQSMNTAPVLIDNCPQDNAHGLHADLHEKRHLHQMEPTSPSAAIGFYGELDADLAADASLQMAGIGQQTIEANQHARYAALIVSPPLYWFAPTLEALSQNKEPENFFRIHRACLEVRLRAAARIKGDKSLDKSSEALQQGIARWDDDANRAESRNPEIRKVHELDATFIACARETAGRDNSILFTTVRQLLEEQAFTDPFAQMLAERIVGAAYYFNHDLILADYEPSRRRSQDRLRSVGLG